MTPARSARDLRESLAHPVVDIDGHVLEFMPALSDYLRDELGPRRVDAYLRFSQWDSRSRPVLRSERDLMARRPPRHAWWGLPAARTMDRACAMLPELLYEHLDDFGIDYVVLYPTVAFGHCGIDDLDTRRGACRAYNRYCAEVFSPFADRMTAAGIIPMDTPAEAIEELDFCKATGIKVVGIPHGVFRRLQEAESRWWFYRSGSPRIWFDTYGLDSEHDYDPVFQRLVDLGFALTSHSGLTFQSSTYTSPTNYSHNHVGAHSAAMDALCRSLFFGGVTRRFPSLAVGFLECGVGWASTLLCAIVEHYKKRNATALLSHDPSNVDLDLLEQLFRSHGRGLLAGHEHDLREALARSVRFTDDAPAEGARDDWGRLAAQNAEELARLFTRPFFFGCEADDRTIANAFSSVNPFGATLQACFSSDLGHWDVERLDGVLGEACELLEEDMIDAAQLRAFLFENPARLHLRANPDFFVGTTIASEAAALRDALP